jgi:hypothetical protein
VSDTFEKETIAIIGGTGKEGKGLAYRWTKAGYPVIIGSREKEKADNAKNELVQSFPDLSASQLEGMTNEDAVKGCSIAVLTIPYQFHEEMVLKMKPYLHGKIFMDVTVPLVPPQVSVVTIPPDGSIAKHAQVLLGEETKVISAFQNISFELLLSDKPIECDVLVCGTDKETRDTGVRLVEDAGLTAWDAGPLENSIVAEGLTSVLIRINKANQVHSAGIRITGVPQEPSE